MCEEEIKKATASVFKYILPKSWSKERKENDPITAERVVDAIKAGKDVEIKNAVITGPFILKSVNAEGEVTINNTTIRDPIDWSYATFKRVLNLKNSIFEGDATFIAVTIEKDIFLEGATFCGEAVFADITVMGTFYSQSTTFEKDVTFEDGIFKKKIEFAKSTFEGDANFGSARIGGTAEFTGATFKQLASFNGAQIKGVAVCNGATFKQQANFNRAQIKDSAFFNPAYLFSWDSVPGDDDKKLKKFLRDDFDIGWAENSEILKSDDGKTISIFKDEKSAKIIIDEKNEKATLKITDGRIHELKVKKENGKLNIYNPATFWGAANFGSARIGSNAEFTGATFKQLASFNGAQIERSAFFKSATFVGDADFISARIGSTADFTGAEFMKQAIFNGAQIEESAFFNPATFVGEANFGSARIGSTAEFTGATFKQQAIFNYALIKGAAEFNGATFKKQAIFSSAQIKDSAFFNHAYLFSWDSVPGDDDKKLKKFLRDDFDIGWAENSEILKSDDGKTISIFKDEKSAEILIDEKKEKATLKITDGRIHELKVKKENGKLNIYNPATFWGEADFGSARIGSTAEFTGAVFKQQASFSGAQIEESTFFNPATFLEKANFISARIGGTADFTGAEFMKQAIFNRAQIEESAFFNPATFVGEANFGSARIGSNAEFTGATFKQQAIFNRTQIEGGALFNPAIFEGETNFGSARIGSNARFTRAEFEQQAYFDSAQFERESHFEGTVFANDVSFQDTSLKTVFLGEPNVQFHAKIDLRGCIYDRIQPISFWKQLMVHLGPYDRQPFTQLEETFRRAGKDKLADDVYYERKCREYTENIAIRKPYLFSWDCVPGDDDEKLKKFLEDDLDIGWTENAEIRKSDDGKTLSISKDEKRSEIILDAIKKKATLKISDGRTFYLNVKKKHGKLNIYRTWDAWLHSALRKHGSWRALLLSALRKPGALLLDRFLFWFTGYGVRLYRLLVAFILILMLGTVIFHLEGAITPELHSMMISQAALPWSEAFWVSLNTFLPIGIPSGADWKPSSQIIPVLGIKFTTFATVLNLAGWILVPVAVAGIAGLLKRSK